MRNSLFRLAGLGLLVAIWLAAQQPLVRQAEAAIAIRNARIVTVSGPVLTKGRWCFAMASSKRSEKRL